MRALWRVFGTFAMAMCLLAAQACKVGDERTPAEDSASSKGVDTLDPADSGEEEEDEGGLGGLDNKFDIGPLPDWGDPTGQGGDEGPKDPVCDIDFLFVIDNSGSMADEQDNLADSVPSFIETLRNKIEQVESIHLGVTTTQAYRENTPECQEIGGLVKKTGTGESSNRECAPYESGLGFMTERDDLEDKFACAAQPGTGNGQYGDERPMEAMIAALTGDNVEEGACNERFVRDSALLVVVVITDEEDDLEMMGMRGSPGEPADWHAAVLDTKGGAEEMVAVLGLIGTPTSDCDELLETGQGNVTNGAEISPRLESFVTMFGDRGFVGDVCAPNYGPVFEEALAVIEFACDNIIPPG